MHECESLKRFSHFEFYGQENCKSKELQSPGRTASKALRVFHVDSSRHLVSSKFDDIRLDSNGNNSNGL